MSQTSLGQIMAAVCSDDQNENQATYQNFQNSLSAADSLQQQPI